MPLNEIEEKKNHMNHEQAFISRQGEGRHHGGCFNFKGGWFAPTRRFSTNHNVG